LLSERTLFLQLYIIKLGSGYKRFGRFEEGQQRLEDDPRKVSPAEAHNEDTIGVPDIPTSRTPKTGETAEVAIYYKHLFLISKN
jgi:hypothetical protein